MRSLLKSLYRLFSSYGLSCVLFSLLMILTYLGTIKQVEFGLYDVQKEYFESMILIHEIDIMSLQIPLPLPGVYLLLVLLFVNLILGTIRRIRLSWVNLGLLVTHLGMLLLLAGGFISFKFKDEGHMNLRPDETSIVFTSDHEWELVITGCTGGDVDTEYIVPMNRIASASGQGTSFYSSMLPFEFEVDRYFRNATIKQASHNNVPELKVIDGFYAASLQPDKSNSRNVPAIYFSMDNKSETATQHILWGASHIPLTLKVAGKSWNFLLRKKQWQIPFSITLRKFTRKLYPGTNIPRVYMSDVVMTENGMSQDVKISMNEPLRNGGFTFFQSGFYEDPATRRMSTTLAVVKNPADRIPLISCFLITLGMLIHFVRRLGIYLKKERARAAS